MPDEAPVTSAILLVVLSSVAIFMLLTSMLVAFNNMVCIASFITGFVYIHSLGSSIWLLVVSGTFRFICSGPALRFPDRTEWQTSAFHREFLPRHFERTSTPAS